MSALISQPTMDLNIQYKTDVKHTTNCNKSGINQMPDFTF